MVSAGGVLDRGGLDRLLERIQFLLSSNPDFAA